MLNYSFSIPDAHSFLDDFLNKRIFLHKKISCFETNKYVTIKEASDYLLSSNQQEVYNTASLLLSLEVEKIERIQKLFEIRKTISTLYDISIKKEVGSNNDFGIYALASYCMNSLFEKTDNYNWLNTALKLNDCLEFLECKNDRQASVAFLSLSKEKKNLDRILY